MTHIIQKLHALGHLRETLKVRIVCKLWKQGIDELTVHENLVFNALTSVEPQLAVDSLIHPWNPFPSRIVRLQLCYGHDDLENAENRADNLGINVLMENYGVHIKYLQVSIQHANCAQTHFVKILNLLKNLKGLVVSECLSPHRFSKKLVENLSDTFTLGNVDELEQLENLKYFKLDDCDCQLKYANLYMKIIEKAQNLEHLEINGYNHLDMGIISLLANRVPNKLALTHLKMDAESENILETLKILIKSELPLKFFSLSINGFGNDFECDVCTSLLHSALEKFSCTLERLELKLSWFESSENSQPKILRTFPSSKKLTKLERFKLVGYSGQLDFLTDLESLQALMIVDFNPESQTVFNCDQSFQLILPKLQEVYLPLQRTLYSADSTHKKKLQNFMYESDTGFIPKYCGLYQEIFP